MPEGGLIGNRNVHVGLLIVFVVIVLALFPEASNERVVVVASMPVVAWYLGQRYERAIIVNAGLADREDVKSVENEHAQFFSRNRREK